MSGRDRVVDVFVASFVVAFPVDIAEAEAECANAAAGLEVQDSRWTPSSPQVKED